MRITKILEKGNCGTARNHGEEACIKAVGPRTETAYKAVSSGKVAQRTEALSLDDTVNTGMVSGLPLTATFQASSIRSTTVC